MFSLLSFVMLSVVFVDVAVRNFAAFLTWAKGAEATIVSEVKTVETDAKNDVSKL